MGLPADLTATVTAIEACPVIREGAGRIVLTTVNHLNDNVWELTAADRSGRREQLRPTGLHKFYSETRGDWVSAQQLHDNEVIRGRAGPLTIVAARPLPGAQRVYNLTVEGEHVYYVSELALLAHNNGCAETVPGGSAPHSRPVYPDPQRPPYNNGKIHKDHIQARSLGGPDTPSNIQDLAAETNMRKGGHEGALKRYEEYLRRNGMSPEDARRVIRDEIESLGKSPPPRPMDPSILDTFPGNP